MFFFLSAVAVVLPAFLAGARDVYLVGTDSSNYYDAFVRAVMAKNLKEYLNYDTDIEMGFRLFTFYVSRVTSMPFFYLFFFHLLILVPIYVALWKWSPFSNSVEGQMIFLFMFFNMTLNTTRQGVGMAFILLGVTFLIKDKPWKFWLCLLFAFFFHRTSVLALIHYFAYQLVRKKKVSGNLFFYMSFISLITGLIYVLFSYTNVASILMDQREVYASYIESEKGGSISKSSLFFYLFVLFVNVRSSLKNCVVVTDYLLLMSVMSLIFIFGAMINQTFARLVLYFTIFETISVSLVCNSNNVTLGYLNYVNSNKIKWVILAFVVIMWVFSVVFHNSNETYPYVFDLTMNML